MHSIILAIGVVGAIATSFVSYFLIAVIGKWRNTLWLKRNGVEADACILHAEIINEDGRYLPFVRLKVEVANDNGNSFITTFDSLFSFSQLSDLVAGNVIRIKYNPLDRTHVSLLKQQPVIKNEQARPTAVRTPQLSLVS